jgi:hypothetical protein
VIIDFKSGFDFACGCPGEAGRCTMPIMGFFALNILSSRIAINYLSVKENYNMKN